MEDLLSDDIFSWTDGLEAMQTDLFYPSAIYDPLNPAFLPVPFDLNQADGEGYAQYGPSSESSLS